MPSYDGVMATATEIDEPVDHPMLRPGTIERRTYQLEMADRAGAGHTLVCLPTGLGKTTVSLLVTAERLDSMDGRILFLAPTKPLVEQHAAFYRSSLDIPEDDIVVFTGEVAPEDRAALWEGATVVIATPQVIENDLIGSRIDLEDVIHLTFDECHRGTGDYAYTFIAERYHDTATDPLVTGMSASPGDDKETILQVCNNLGIEEIAVRTDNDPSVEPYTFDTDLQRETVTLPDEIISIRDTLQDVIADRLDELKSLGIAETTDPELSQKDLGRMQAKLQRMIDAGNRDGYRGMSLHAEVMKLKRAVEIAETQSVAAVRRYFERQQEDARGSGASKATQRLVSEPRVQEVISRAEAFDDIHPKFSKTRILLAKTLGIEGGERVIVFTESRDTAEVLTEFLSESFSARRFVGQRNKDGRKGMTQRDQQEVLQAFRDQEFEILVSTSVAEEGLDIPDVDLVVFFEPVPSAIRAIQRRGRTGRHQKGEVIVLIAEDTRDEPYYWISRHREDEMQEQLRRLKHLEDELVEELGGVQGRLDQFVESDESTDDHAPNTKQVDDTADPTAPAMTDGASRAATESGDESVVASAGGDEDAVEIVTDQREQEATISRELTRRDGFRVRLETLAVGDYVLSDRVVVERKTVEDFLDTLLGGERSLFDQASRMVEQYDRPVVIIEGTDLLGTRNVHPNAVRGALASLAVDYGISVLFTDDVTGTTELLALIAKREQRERDRSPAVHGDKGGRTLAEQQEYVLSSIVDIGPVTARRLLEELDTIETVVKASVEDLQSVEGVGTVTAERIRRVVSTPYDPD